MSQIKSEEAQNPPPSVVSVSMFKNEGIRRRTKRDASNEATLEKNSHPEFGH